MAAKILAFTLANRLAPTPLNGKVPPRRVPNSEVRSREYLTSDEVEALMSAARKVGRHGHRDATLILQAYRHGLRVSELVALRWDQVELKRGLLHVTRAKNGSPSTHPIRGPEIRALRRLHREYPDSPYVFTTERRGPLTASTVRKIVARAGTAGRTTVSGTPAHAPSCVRIQACQRRPRHPIDPALPRAQEHHPYCSVHRAISGSLQRVLAGLRSPRFG